LQAISISSSYPALSTSLLGPLSAARHGFGKQGLICSLTAAVSYSITCSEKVSTTERELLAAVWGERECRAYLGARRLWRDHKALQWLADMKGGCMKLARRALLLPEFDFVVRH